MKKKAKLILVLIIIALIITALFSLFILLFSGKQQIKISTTSKAYTNSDFFVSITAKKDNDYIETKNKIKLLDLKGKKVKDVKVSYDGNTAKISVPDIEPGSYFIQAKVSSKFAKDTVKKRIYISDGYKENVIITLDKGIYKPGDTVNFRALFLNKENEEPIKKDVNVYIYDGNDNRIYNQQTETSEYGILSGSFTLANEVNNGIYKLVVKSNNNETTKSFKVNPYIAPKYEVKINLDKENYLVNDTAKINISAKYFFGEPVENVSYKVYINNTLYDNITADEQGNAEIEYKIRETNNYTIAVEAIDSSNYFVEETVSFIASEDIFHVDLLPEHGFLVGGKKNNIYVFTTNPDGTPVKAYVTISSTKFTKQIATDENGIGMFSINIKSLDNSSYTNYYYDDQYTEQDIQEFIITARNMNGDKIYKNISLYTRNANLLLYTDKVTYEQGEDITISVSSSYENKKNIYIFKNDKLIKQINTESPDTTINLDDTYGIIDIYLTEDQASHYTDYRNPLFYNRLNYTKRTIFIKPDKKLNIIINTNKDEYTPGEDISISFGTTDENNNSIDSALLVSMLDNSILNLANNDISIDNIKLALSEFKFSNDLDAATLYSCIINDKSEQTLLGLLLKQTERDIPITETFESGYETAVTAGIALIVSVITLIVIFFILILQKFKISDKVIEHIVNCSIFTLTILLLLDILNYEFKLKFYTKIPFPFIILLCFAFYINVLSKASKIMFKTSFLNILTIFITVMPITIIVMFSYYMEVIVISAAIISLLIILILLLYFCKFKKIKIKTILSKARYLINYIVALTASLLFATIIDSTKIGGISVIIFIVSTYFFNILLNFKYMSNIEETSKNKIFSQPKLVVYMLIILFLFTQVFLSSIKTFSGDVEPVIEDSYTDGVVDTSSSSTKINSIFSSNESKIFIGKQSTQESVKEETPNSSDNNNQENISEENIEKTIDTHIRNVFLESMCFIPELITTNGKANLDLQLSDNITTWTIQTMGNTKDGRIGYGKLDTVKVFKEFFVDFELPKNLVRTDTVSIPVTVYNYTNTPLNTTLTIKEEDWFALNTQNDININIEPETTKMTYIPITILKNGNYKFRVEAKGDSLTDIVEKEINISPNGYKIEKVVSSGILENDTTEDILILEDIIENTAKAKVKIYSSTISQNIEGMENIFRMPTGCFEQISSALYPNILALKYLEENKIIDEKIKAKALNYISSGYQKLLTYEVTGKSGGFSLYGASPAETELTAYGLMELTDLQDVYPVDENVLNRMTEFLYKRQNSNGSFSIQETYTTRLSGEKLARNAYIVWALSQSDPTDKRLSKSINYLKDNLDKVDDNYTLALIANCLANVGDKKTQAVIKRLVNNIEIYENNAYLSSNITDYYGTKGINQTTQTVALTSLVLSKTSSNSDMNKLLINYLISRKDSKGTWHSTQATILALKALNEANNKLKNQTIAVKVNSEEQKIEIKENPLELYELTFNNLSKENKLHIDIEEGNAYYEIIEEYYVPYETLDKTDDKLEINVEANNTLKVNEILDAKIQILNNSRDTITNGMVTISIPQGFTTIEENLMLLKENKIIEKYETTYTSVNLYLRNIEIYQITNLDIKFRAAYPVEITGLTVKAYDYYNPEIEGKSDPLKITVTE